MKKFILFQPFVAFVLLIAFASQAASPILAFSMMLALIAAVIVLLYLSRNRHLKRLEQEAAKLQIPAERIVPISAGGLAINALAFGDDSLHVVTNKGVQQTISYSNIAEVHVNVLELFYTIVSKDGSKTSFRLGVLKSRDEVMGTVKNPQTGVGALGIVGLPLLSQLSALKISAASSRERVEALNKKLEEAVDGLTVEQNYDGGFKKGDLVLGTFLGLEIVALVIVFAVLFYTAES